MSRRKCINYCKANRKVSQFFQKYDIQNKNMISMIIPTPGPKQSDITVREVGEWSSCFLDDQQTCGTGRKYRTKAQGFTDQNRTRTKKILKTSVLGSLQKLVYLLMVPRCHFHSAKKLKRNSFKYVLLNANHSQ